MNIVIRNSLFLLMLLCVSACSRKTPLIVDYTNKQITYSGRVDTSQGKATEMYWSGTSIQFNFEGQSIDVLLEDESGDNYYNVIIDKDSLFILRPDTTKRYYQLASDLPKGTHSVEVFKRTEWNRGKTVFYGFQLPENAKILPRSKDKKKKIEFYGDSISAGYAVEDSSGEDSPDSTFTNNYLSYTTITAKHFDADYRCICRSGIGVTISWFPLIMPEMYNRLVPTDTASIWDFSKYLPDLVVVNLLQNDSWLVNMPDNEQFKKRFGSQAPSENFIITAYINFISEIRNQYPETNIICALGSMDATKEGSLWMNYIEKAVLQLDDNKVFTHFVPYKGTSGHPSVKEQELIAKSLIKFIEMNIDW